MVSSPLTFITVIIINTVFLTGFLIAVEYVKWLQIFTSLLGYLFFVWFLYVCLEYDLKVERKCKKEVD